MPIKIESYNVHVGIVSDHDVAIKEGLGNLFAGRYLPKFKVEEVDNVKDVDALIKWEVTENFFGVEKYSLGKKDVFEVKSPPPQPYVCESPYFFLLQVLSRQYMKKGYVMFTDTVSFLDPSTGEAFLILGYPHTGKSTILALAYSKGMIALSTENTLLKINRDYAEIVGGTKILVYDPIIKELYNITLTPQSMTRHGYGIIDLTSLEEPVPKIHSIYVIYCSFTSMGLNKKKVSGRKAMKLLWHFSSSVIRGLDYYEPIPLNLSDLALEEKLVNDLHHLVDIYSGRFYEVFGSHRTVFEHITSLVN